MATKKPAKAAKKADKAAKKTTKAAKEPIELKLPSGFTAEHVKKAITGDIGCPVLVFSVAGRLRPPGGVVPMLLSLSRILRGSR